MQSPRHPGSEVSARPPHPELPPGAGSRLDAGEQWSATDTRSRDITNHGKRLFELGLRQGDIHYLKDRGKAPEKVLAELEDLMAPRRYPQVVAPALVADGTMQILKLGDLEYLREQFVRHAQSRKLEMIVPAGGAATRQMNLLRLILKNDAFEELTTPGEIQQKAHEMHTEYQALQARRKLTDGEKADLKNVEEVLFGVPAFWEEGICGKKYAFYYDLEKQMAETGHDIEDAIAREDIRLIAKFIFAEPGLNYGASPKLFMKLHAYDEPDGSVTTRTALEEHVREAALLLRGTGALRLHFIVSPEHHGKAQALLAEVLASPAVTDHIGACGFSLANVEVSFSLTDPRTDCVALDTATGQIARDSKKNPLLRNAGHGSVVGNLSRPEVDGFWLQNIDNVQCNPQVQEVVILYKQVLAALAIELETEAHGYLRQLREVVPQDLVQLNLQILEFVETKLQMQIDTNWLSTANPVETAEALQKILSRPIVVAGFVPLKEGQAGGGPFMLELELDGVRVKKASIVEQAEFEHGANDTVFTGGEFFNPVLLFVSRKSVEGDWYQMESFSDPSRAFIAEKPGIGSSRLRTLEMPGLWNGGTAFAIQVNVAIPSCCLSAIKTLAGTESFLSDGHQSDYSRPIRHLDFQRRVVDNSTAAYLNGLAGETH